MNNKKYVQKNWKSVNLLLSLIKLKINKNESFNQQSVQSTVTNIRTTNIMYYINDTVILNYFRHINWCGQHISLASITNLLQSKKKKTLSINII